MSKREFLAALKKAGTVYVWVTWTDDDGVYVWTSKEAIRVNLKAQPDGLTYRASLREDGDLYVG